MLPSSSWFSIMNWAADMSSRKKNSPGRFGDDPCLRGTKECNFSHMASSTSKERQIYRAQMVEPSVLGAVCPGGRGGGLSQVRDTAFVFFHLHSLKHKLKNRNKALKRKPRCDLQQTAHTEGWAPPGDASLAGQKEKSLHSTFAYAVALAWPK